MFYKQYKVKGEDVNDFMVMENCSYLYYSDDIKKAFLSESGMAQKELIKKGIKLLDKKTEITYRNHLMFTQEFKVYYKISFVNSDYSKMVSTHYFYNANKILCTTIHSEVVWFDFVNEKEIMPPNRFLEVFKH